MQILEHGAENERTLLFLPCTAEPVWAFADTVALLAQQWHVFQAVYDGHQPEYPGDFLSVEKTADDILAWFSQRGIRRLDTAYGCSLGGCCLTRLLALGTLPIGCAVIDGVSPPISCRWQRGSDWACGIICNSSWWQAAAAFWRRLFPRSASPRQEKTRQSNMTGSRRT